MNGAGQEVFVEYGIALLPGDYTGPEVIAEAVKVIDVVGGR
ncbi:MAG: hypothetical protein ACOC7M_03455 [Chloroflexota bacterium]